MYDTHQFMLPFFKSFTWLQFIKKKTTSTPTTNSTTTMTSMTSMTSMSSMSNAISSLGGISSLGSLGSSNSKQLLFYFLISWLLFLDACPLRQGFPYYHKLCHLTGGMTSPSTPVCSTDHNHTPPILTLPPGLTNLRNTCYLNSILQSLFSLTPFSQLFLPQSSSPSSPGLYTFEKESFGEEFQRFFHQLESTRQSTVTVFNRIVSPLGIAKKLQIDISTQEDAQELLLRILELIDDSLLPTEKTSSGGMKKDKKQKKKQVKPITMEEIEDVLLPSATMKMYLQQNITCIKHAHIASSKILKHLDLSVPVKGMRTLTRAIATAFAPEILNDRENLYKCDEHGYVETKKSIALLNFPRIFTLHLNRFSYDPLNYIFKKINDPLDIPVQLNLREYCNNEKLLSNEPRAGIYNLSAIVIHQGSIERGHYYTLAKVLKNPKDECQGYHWIQCNDHMVSTMTEEQVLKIAKGEINTRPAVTSYEKVYGTDAVSTNAYLLFYTAVEQ